MAKTNNSGGGNQSLGVSEAVRLEFERQEISMLELHKRTCEDRERPRSGVPYNTINRWCNRQGECSSRTLDRIVAALGIRVEIVRPKKAGRVRNSSNSTK